MAADNPVKKITAGRVNDALKDHLQEHEQVLNPMLKNHQVLLVGEKGDNGLCFTSKDHEKRIVNLEKVGDKIDNLKWGIVLWAATQLLVNLPNLIALAKK